MEIRNLPIPYSHYPVTISGRNASPAQNKQQDTGTERAITSGHNAASTTQHDNSIFPKPLLRQSNGSYTTTRQGGLQNNALPHSHQQALSRYQEIEKEDNTSRATEVLHRIDTHA